jgi:hypothetical protein
MPSHGTGGKNVWLDIDLLDVEAGKTQLTLT